MKKTLSPYYITIPLESPLTSETAIEYRLELRVWDGLESAIPVSTTYSKTVKNISNSTGIHKVNVSRLINDFIDLTPQSNGSTAVIDGNNQRWFETSIFYTTIDPADDDVQQEIETKLIVKGYAYGNEGENTDTPTNKILLSGTEFNVNRDGIFTLPIETDALTVTAISYPSNEINFSELLVSTTDSGEMVKYVFIDVSEASTDDYIEITYNGVTTTLNILDECKYTPIDIVFFNKEGSQQVLTFFKDRTDRLKVTDESFESDRNQPSLGNHQFVRYNVQGRSSFKVHSGFVDESMNETFHQLLLSSAIWSYESGVFTPLNIKSTSFEDKTRNRERLISYEINFDLSYNEINNI